VGSGTDLSNKLPLPSLLIYTGHSKKVVPLADNSYFASMLNVCIDEHFY